MSKLILSHSTMTDIFEELDREQAERELPAKIEAALNGEPEIQNFSIAESTEAVEEVTQKKEWIDILSLNPTDNISLWKRFDRAPINSDLKVEIIESVICSQDCTYGTHRNYVRILVDLDLHIEQKAQCIFIVANRQKHMSHEKYYLVQEELTEFGACDELIRLFWDFSTKKQVTESAYDSIDPKTTTNLRNAFLQTGHMMLYIDDPLIAKYESPEHYIQYAINEFAIGTKSDELTKNEKCFSLREGHIAYVINSFPSIVSIHTKLSPEQRNQVYQSIIECLKIEATSPYEAARAMADLDTYNGPIDFIFIFFDLSDTEKYEIMRIALTKKKPEHLEPHLEGKKIEDLTNAEIFEVFTGSCCSHRLSYICHYLPEVTPEMRSNWLYNETKESQYSYWNKSEKFCPEPEHAWNALGENDDERRKFIEKCQYSISNNLFKEHDSISLEAFTMDQWFQMHQWVLADKDKDLSGYHLWNMVENILRMPFSSDQIASLIELVLNGIGPDRYMKMLQEIYLSTHCEETLAPTYQVILKFFRNNGIHLDNRPCGKKIIEQLIASCALEPDMKHWRKALFLLDTPEDQHDILEDKSYNEWLSATFLHSVGVNTPEQKAQYWQNYITAKTDASGMALDQISSSPLDTDARNTNINLSHELVQVIKLLDWEKISEVVKNLQRYPLEYYERKELAEHCIQHQKHSLYLKNLRLFDLSLAAESEIFNRFIFQEEEAAVNNGAIGEILRNVQQSQLNTQNKFYLAEILAEGGRAEELFPSWKSYLPNLDVENWTLAQFTRFTNLIAGSVTPIEPSKFLCTFRGTPSEGILMGNIDIYNESLFTSLKSFSEFSTRFESAQAQKEIDGRGNISDITKHKDFQTPIYNPSLQYILENLESMELVDRDRLREFVFTHGEFRTVVAADAMDALSFSLPQKIRAWSRASRLDESYIRTLMDYAPKEASYFLTRFVQLPIYHQRKLITLLNSSAGEHQEIRIRDLIKYGDNKKVMKAGKDNGLDMKSWLEFAEKEERHFTVELQTDELHGRVSAPWERIMEDYEKSHDSIKSFRMTHRQKLSEIQGVNPKNKKPGTLDSLCENLVLQRMRGQIKLFKDQKDELVVVRSMDQKKRTLVKKASIEIADQATQEENDISQQELKYELKALEKEQSKAMNRLQSAAQYANKGFISAMETMEAILAQGQGGRNELPTESVKQLRIFLEERKGHATTRAVKNGALTLMNPKINAEDEKKEKRFCVRLADRNLVENLFLGDKTACCIGVGKGTRGDLDIIDYLSDVGTHLLEVVDEDTGEPVYMSFLFLGVREDNGEPALVLDNIEGAALHSALYRGQMRDAIFEFSHELAAATGIPKDNIVLGCSNNDVDIKDLSTVVIPSEEVIEKNSEEKQTDTIVKFQKLGPKCIDEHPKGRFYLEAENKRVKQVPRPIHMQWAAVA